MRERFSVGNCTVNPVLPLLRIFLFAIGASLVGAVRAGSAVALDKADFEKELNALVKTSGLNAGVAIKDLAGGDEFLLGADAVFPQGSSIRIHLVCELYRQASTK